MSNDKYLKNHDLYYSYNGPTRHGVSRVRFNNKNYDFDYDSKGNMIEVPNLGDPDNIKAREIMYNAENKPLTISLDGTPFNVYTYDGEGVRAYKKANNIETFYFNDKYEKRAGDNIKYIFANNLRIARIDNQGVKFYHKNHLGSSMQMSREDGTAIERVNYMPFGEQRNRADNTDPDHMNYKYTDQEQDIETGLYNYHARLYDPALRMFITPDSIVPDYSNPQSLNRFAYVLNNPLAFVDSTGMYWEETDSGYQEYSGPSEEQYASRDAQLDTLWSSTAYNPFGLGYIPKLTMGTDRYDSIINNTPAVFPISGNPGANGRPPFYQLDFMSTVNEYENHISLSSSRHGVDPNLVRSIIYLETTHGYYDKLFSLFDKNSSILPMNIQSPRWDALGTSRAALKDPATNIDIGVKLLSRIQARVLNPTPAKIGSLYNCLGREKVNDYGARLNNYYNSQPW